MNVTKYEHSCLVVSKGSARLVIDPGSFLATLPETSGVVAIVLTHEHADHFSADRVRELLAANPDARVIGPQGVADAASASDIEVEVVHGGDTVEVEPFTLRFFGETHNVIHSSIPVIDNVGVLVDDELFYPGDSYTEPGVEVELLAAPVGAPWLKIGEAMDYVLAVKPRRAFPVHDMTLSVAGKKMQSDRLQWATEQNGGEFTVLEPGESIDL
ncbi:MBL fold metallo-hydrolase [Protaetiibacter mangrovi]|uniref:MBL fold metallo-hydrolase n=1 Tax=Protaetiibacter mangrovi TaxID=2970926 RepID=A0ABT1ZHY6_9MICO|nr:MBL fold metallo-hydrolase [Protaetiibacter mangrovi]MCS0500316.1 MBL fold metallo-hydrolase [Protaetiibacter mangrovi]TPX00530.1 MBL fold metallo-hydrolase [Schumannella luteola]